MTNEKTCSDFNSAIPLWRSTHAVSVLALVLSGFLAVAPQDTRAQAASADDSGFCDDVSQLRSNYSKLNRAIAAKTVQDNPDKIEDWDTEEDSCISDYGVNLGFSFTSIASSLLDSLADQACSALDNFIGSQLSALDSTVTAPMDMGGLDVSFGQSDTPFSTEATREEIGVDFEDAFSDQLDRLPQVESGYDFDASEGRSVNDFDYLNTRPDYDYNGGR